MSIALLPARVYAMRYEADGIVSVELRPATPDVVFPRHAAGAHIDLHLANGLVRSYSLFNPQEDSQRYVVGVLNDKKSRGGSRFVHEQLRVGSVIQISPPRNHFALNEEAARSVLVSGGIGITPIFAMLQRLKTLGKPVKLLYCARTRAEAAFIPIISAMASSNVEVAWHFDDEKGAPPNLVEMLAPEGADTHFYCCGPGPMLDSFEKALQSLSFPHCHIERFAAPAAATKPETERGFEVELAQTGKTVTVPAGKSILDTLIEAGLDCNYSCKEGVCGSCETKVLAGQVDHRDCLLSQEEQAAMNTMMICVSRCKSKKLVLDL